MCVSAMVMVMVMITVSKHGMGPRQTWLERGSSTGQVCTLTSPETCLGCSFPICEMGIILPQRL